MGRAWIICKKIFSLALVFNALLTIACAAGIIAGFYWFFPDWQPFYPYLVSGVVFWVVIAAAAINVFPSALLGRKLHTGRFLFHHYFYGFIVLVCASLYVITFTRVPLSTIFLVNNTSMEVNAGRFFLLGGLTLVLDDLPDVSRRVESGLNWLKAKALSFILPLRSHPICYDECARMGNISQLYFVVHCVHYKHHFVCVCKKKCMAKHPTHHKKSASLRCKLILSLQP